MSPSIRTVPTASGATAVQVIWGWKQGRPTLDHIGSAHTEHDLVLLKARAQRLIDGEQTTLDLGVDTTPVSTGAPSSPVPITSERTGHLINAIHCAYAELGFNQATGGDQVLKNLVTARIMQPGSKIDSIETLAEIGVESVSYATIKRRLPTYATTDFRDNVTAAYATHAGISPGVLVLYDVTTLLCRRRHNRVYADGEIMPTC